MRLENHLLHVFELRCIHLFIYLCQPEQTHKFCGSGHPTELYIFNRELYFFNQGKWGGGGGLITGILRYVPVST